MTGAPGWQASSPWTRRLIASIPLAAALCVSVVLLLRDILWAPSRLPPHTLALHGLLVAFVVMSLCGLRPRMSRASKVEYVNEPTLLERLPCMVSTANAQGIQEYANERLVSYCGAARSQGGGFEWHDLVHPDEREYLAEQWRRCIQTAKGTMLTHRLCRADGSYRWFQARIEPAFGGEGSVRRWYSVLTEVDDLVTARETDRNTAQRLRIIVDTIQAYLLSWSAGGELLYVNQRIVDYSGLTFGQLIAGAWQGLIHADDLERVTAHWAACMRTGAQFSDQYRWRRSDGTYRWMDAKASPLRDESAKIICWYGINIDVDESKRLARELKESEEKLVRAAQSAALGELAAAIAHEINQPLAAIAANGAACVRWLKANPPNVERARLTAERIARSGSAAAQFAQRIRGLFKHAAPEKAPLNIEEVIMEVVRLMNDQFVAARTDIRTEIEQDLPRIMGDRIQIQQVLINLIRNAIDAMEGVNEMERVVEVWARRDSADWVSVEVLDYGSGFEDGNRLFEPFYTTKKNGMGVGLSICRSIVEAHGGRLWAVRNVDRGSRFIFTIAV